MCKKKYCVSIPVAAQVSVFVEADDEEQAILIKKLEDLHELRRSMSAYSIYHGMYVDEAIALNQELVELTGFTYVEHQEKYASLDL
jgi:hypothetical protein